MYINRAVTTGYYLVFQYFVSTGGKFYLLRLNPRYLRSTNAIWIDRMIFSGIFEIPAPIKNLLSNQPENAVKSFYIGDIWMFMAL